MKINERFPPELLAILTHFYRGEVQRATDWRRRLDTTTNWAIIAMTATFSWAFAGGDSSHGENHVIFYFTSWTAFLLMCIEARRYRYFDVWRTRVRMLEVHLLMPALNPELDIVQGDWREVLSNDLLLPSYKISFWESMSERLRANYIWIFGGLLAGWLLRVYTAALVAVTKVRDGNGELVQDGNGELTAEDLYAAFGYENIISPPVIIGGFVLFWCLILAILLTTWKRRKVTGEIRRRDRKAKQWPI